MPRRDSLVLLSFIFILEASVRKDREQNFFGRLEKFSAYAEQIGSKPIPDIKQWTLQRMKTIETLKELRKKLDNVCFYASCGKAAGIGMGILCILSSFITFMTGILGLTVPFSISTMSFSSFICPIAYFTKEASSALESILSEKYQNSIRSVLQKDKEVSKSLDEWLEFSPHLETEIEKNLGFDLKSDNSLKVIFLNEFYKSLGRFKNFEDTVNHMKYGKYSSLLDESIELDELRKFSKQILDSSSFSKKIHECLIILNALIDSRNYIRSFNGDYRNIQGKKVVFAIKFIQDRLNIKVPYKLSLHFRSIKCIRVSKRNNFLNRRD